MNMVVPNPVQGYPKNIFLNKNLGMWKKFYQILQQFSKIHLKYILGNATLHSVLATGDSVHLYYMMYEFFMKNIISMAIKCIFVIECSTIYLHI